MADADCSHSNENAMAKENELKTLGEEEIYARVKEISDLVAMAKLQAKEVEIRARYAAEFAEKAMTEAHSAHQVSEALAKTSRIVAALALEFSNNANECLENFVDPETSGAPDNSSFLSFHDLDVSFQTPDNTCAANTSVAGEHLFTKDNVKADDSSVTAENSNSDKKPAETDNSKTDDKRKDVKDSQERLAEKMTSLALKRTILLYRDSKMINSLMRSFEKGDAVADQDEQIEDPAREDSPCDID